MIIDCPVSSIVDLSSMKISALPSIIWMKVSKGEIFSVMASPESNETALTFPVVFRIIVFINTELRTYSRISTTIKAFDFQFPDFPYNVICLYSESHFISGIKLNLCCHGLLTF